jgi:hypothetical protein
LITLPQVRPGDTAVTFDQDAYLAGLDPDLLGCGEGRRLLTRLDPLTFGLIYLGPHLINEQRQTISFGDAHLDWVRYAQQWVRPAVEPKAWRHVFVAPRKMGKSTWWHLVIPMWAAAHGHAQFIAAFSDSGSQATIHLGSFKHELDTNDLLRADFPDLCTASKRPSGVSESDSQSLYIASSGFVFSAKGIDAKTLGLKVGHLRPDVIILDDVEPDESNYSPFQADKRLGTITDAILPMDDRARVVLVGTVTMPGSIIHQTVKAAKGTDEADWIRDEKFVCHHYRPILAEDDGTRRSCWPGLWTIDYLEENKTTHAFRKNFDNDPLARESVYWSAGDFTYGSVEAATRTGLWVDPAVTSKSSSDYTGLAVVAYSAVEKKCEIRYAAGVRLAGRDLRLKLIALMEAYPEIARVFVEVNQGGDLWKDVFHNLPVKVVTHTVSESKEVRFARSLPYWQRHRVLHAQRLDTLEEQAVAFPRGQYDDVIDAAVAGVLHFLHPVQKQRSTVTTDSYI